MKILNLSYCNLITDNGLKCLGSLEELSDLELRSLDKITSVGMAAFAAKCMSLTELDLKHCEKIDDSGFWAIAYNLQNLRQVHNLFSVVIFAVSNLCNEIATFRNLILINRVIIEPHLLASVRTMGFSSVELFRDLIAITMNKISAPFTPLLPWNIS